MKKILIVLALIVLLVSNSCTYRTQFSEKYNYEIIKNITYFKDQRTGLCFAIVSITAHSYSVTSITCVPCDSLKNKNIEIKKFN